MGQQQHVAKQHNAIMSITIIFETSSMLVEQFLLNLSSYYKRMRC